jgi:hypothetical protein
MTRPLFASAAILIITFALVIGALHMQPQENPAFGAFGDCSLPCWQGIRLGTTSADEAVTRIHTIGAGGMDVSQIQCYISDFCVMYNWRSTETQALYASLEINYGRLVMLQALTPGFSVGQALLAQDTLSLEGGDLNLGVENQLYINLHLAGGSLILRTVTTCPGSYQDLLDAPVNMLELEAPDANRELPHPLLTFSQFQWAFNRVCGKLQ